MTDYISPVSSTYGLALNPTTGDMYILYEVQSGDSGSGSGSGVTTRRLGLLDTASGSITDIGLTGNICDIAFGGNILYGVSGGGNGDFVSISLTTGTAYQWKLDGVDIAGATDSTHIPVASGDYTCDIDGELTSNSITITILPAPSASISATPNPVDLGIDPTGTVIFANTSTGGDTYWWDFDNGFTTSTENPSFPFTTVGTYDVWFWVEESANGCLYSSTVTVSVVSTLVLLS